MYLKSSLRTRFMFIRLQSLAHLLTGNQEALNLYIISVISLKLVYVYWTQLKSNQKIREERNVLHNLYTISSHFPVCLHRGSWRMSKKSHLYLKLWFVLLVYIQTDILILQKIWIILFCGSQVEPNSTEMHP